MHCFISITSTVPGSEAELLEYKSRLQHLPAVWYRQILHLSLSFCIYNMRLLMASASQGWWDNSASTSFLRGSGCCLSLLLTLVQISPLTRVAGTLALTTADFSFWPTGFAVRLFDFYLVCSWFFSLFPDLKTNVDFTNLGSSPDCDHCSRGKGRRGDSMWNQTDPALVWRQHHLQAGSQWGAGSWPADQHWSISSCSSTALPALSCFSWNSTEENYGSGVSAILIILLISHHDYIFTWLDFNFILN